MLTLTLSQELEAADMLAVKTKDKPGDLMSPGGRLNEC